MNIKGKNFGKGKPVICVPVVEQTAEGILAAIKDMAERCVDMIEWRMDWYADIGDFKAVKGLLEKIGELVTDTVFLCTFRSRSQGGEKSISGEEYLCLNLLAAKSGAADMIDVEFYEVSEPKSMIEQLKDTGVKVVCSNHNFQETPTVAEMKRQLSEMAAAGADFAKLAVMPQRKQDVLHLMEAVLDVKNTYPDSHLIAMSMESDGVISRLLGGWFYSEVTFASFGRASAPGQVTFGKAREIIGQIEECIR